MSTAKRATTLALVLAVVSFGIVSTPAIAKVISTVTSAEPSSPPGVFHCC
jgi:hypothetical protein